MEAAAKMIFEIGDQWKPAILFRGRKKTKAVLNGYPIRIHDTSLRAFDTAEPIMRRGKEATPAEVATYFLDRASTHGITKGAQRLLESILSKADVDPDEVDALEEDETAVESIVKETEVTKASARDMLADRAEDIAKFKKKPKKERPKQTPDDAAEEASEAKAHKKAAGAVPAGPPSVVGPICAELKIDPKDARKRLRAAGLSAPYTDAEKIRAILAAPPK